EADARVAAVDAREEIVMVGHAKVAAAFVAGVLAVADERVLEVVVEDVPRHRDEVGAVRDVDLAVIEVDPVVQLPLPTMSTTQELVAALVILVAIESAPPVSTLVATFCGAD